MSKPLTKSLHTITAATHVAVEVLRVADDAGRSTSHITGESLAKAALEILGQALDQSDTSVRIVGNCAKLLGQRALKGSK